MTHANTLFSHLVVAHHKHKYERLRYTSSPLKRRVRLVRQKKVFHEHLQSERERRAQLKVLRSLQHELVRAEKHLEKLGEHEKARALHERLAAVREKIQEKEKKLAST